ncbi:MAG: outer membrane beta-barrel protein [Dysgonamonadaceae bacterium]|jgi:hypothetical protein|nr:outer membrane beta-barrel protein [Dysgonamonadaceae bacterium]
MNNRKIKFLFLLLISFCSVYAQTEPKESYQKWRLGISGGMGYRTIDTSEDERKLTDMGFNAQKVNDCYNDLKWGIQGNTDIHYLFHPNFGIGIKYAFFYTDGKFEESSSFNIPLSSGFGQMYLKMDEKDYFNYIGPSLHARSLIGESKFAVSGSLSGGYSHYRSNYEATLLVVQGHPIDPEFGLVESKETQLTGSYERFIMKGHSLGLYAGAGLEYFFNRRVALGFDCGYFYSSLNDVTLTMKMDDKTTVSKKVKLKEFMGKKENLSRMDFSLGLKIYL